MTDIWSYIVAFSEIKDTNFCYVSKSIRNLFIKYHTINSGTIEHKIICCILQCIDKKETFKSILLKTKHILYDNKNIPISEYFWSILFKNILTIGLTGYYITVQFNDTSEYVFPGLLFMMNFLKGTNDDDFNIFYSIPINFCGGQCDLHCYENINKYTPMLNYLNNVIYFKTKKCIKRSRSGNKLNSSENESPPVFWLDLLILYSSQFLSKNDKLEFGKLLLDSYKLSGEYGISLLIDIYKKIKKNEISNSKYYKTNYIRYKDLQKDWWEYAKILDYP